MSTATGTCTVPVTSPVDVFRLSPAGSAGAIANVGAGRFVTVSGEVAMTVPTTPEIVWLAGVTVGSGVASMTTVAVPRWSGTGEMAVTVYVVLLAALDLVPLMTPVSGFRDQPAGRAGDTLKKGSVTPVTTIGVVLKFRPIVPGTAWLAGARPTL